MRTIWDIVVIGAGPAGMKAAITATKHNSSVLVLDRQHDAGGQIFRSAGLASPKKREDLGTDYRKGHSLVREFLECDATFIGGANIWHVAPGRVYYSYEGKSHMVYARSIIIATGGMERPVPMPGWTLPGVIGAGAADVMLKSASLFPSGPVVMCGNGPLVLQTAVHLQHCKIPVAGIVLTGKLSSPFKALPRVMGAFARPAYMMHGMSMGLQMILKSRCYPSAQGLSINKENNTFSVSFTSMGRKKVLQGTSVLLHEGVISETRITRLARLNHAWNADQRYWHVQTDKWGTTNLEGIYCAGDTAGVRGAEAAMAFGVVCALEICRKHDRITLEERDALSAAPFRQLRRCDMMQPFMDRVFSPNPDYLQPDDATTVCRCEELTAGELRKVIKEGCYSLDGLKAQARPGMGACQGRMCASAVAEMINNTMGVPMDRLEPYRAQPPLFPLSLKELATMDLPYEDC